MLRQDGVRQIQVVAVSENHNSNLNTHLAASSFSSPPSGKDLGDDAPDVPRNLQAASSYTVVHDDVEFILEGVLAQILSRNQILQHVFQCVNTSLRGRRVSYNFSRVPWQEIPIIFAKNAADHLCGAYALFSELLVP